MLCQTICIPKGRAASSTGRKELPVSPRTRKEKAVHVLICPFMSPWETGVSVKAQKFVLCRWIALARWRGTPLSGILSLHFPPFQKKSVLYFQFLCQCFTLFSLLILTACALWREGLDHGAIFRGLLHSLLPTRHNAFLWKVRQRKFCFLIHIS